MAVLGYLPESTDAVLALQLPILLDSLGPAAAEDPAQALLSLGLPETVVKMIDGMSVVGLKQVDQLALGLGFTKSVFPPQATLVIRTREAFRPDDLDRRTKSNEQEKGGRTLHGMKGGPLGEVYWWAADDRTLVVTLLTRDFEDVPKQSRAGVGHLKRELRSRIDDQLTPDACLWLVADSDKWGEYMKLYANFPLSPLRGRTDLVDPAGRLRSVAFSVPAAADGKAELTVGLKSAEAGDGLRTRYGERFADQPVEVGGENDVVRVRTGRDTDRLRTLIFQLTESKP